MDPGKVIMGCYGRKGELISATADVFVSYTREDRLAAQKVAETLKRHGWSL
jgi:hypothetical protein